MKKLKWLVAVVLLVFSNTHVFAQTIDDYAQESLSQLGYTPYNKALSAIVVDAHTGDVFFEQEANKTVDPASITKLMTAYVVYDAVKSGQLSWDQQIVATANDAAISQLPELSNTTIVAGESYTLRELMTMHLVTSSNVASIMMANLVSSNDLTRFIQLMNDKAQALSLTHTVYTNPSGALTADFNGLITIVGYPDTQPSYSTAADVAKLSVALLKEHPEIIEMTRLSSVTVGQHTQYPETLRSTNALLPDMVLETEGVEGLKTGTSGESGYSFVASVKRGDLRLIVVVLGVGHYTDAQASVDRFYYSNALIEQTYKEYQKKTMLTAGNYMVDNIEIQVNQNYEVVVAKDEPSLTYRLENDTLVIDRPLANIHGQTTDVLPIVNVTKIKQEEERRQREQLMLWLAVIVMSGVLITLMAILTLRAKRYKRRTVRRR